MESILQKERSLTDLERETFFRRLGLLLQGGLPILRALGALEGHSGPAVKKLCRSLARSLGRGFSLSQALRQPLGKPAASCPWCSGIWRTFIRKNGRIRKPFSRPVFIRPWC